VFSPPNFLFPSLDLRQVFGGEIFFFLIIENIYPLVV
jgi:hypothetical protein